MKSPMSASAVSGSSTRTRGTGRRRLRRRFIPAHAGNRELVAGQAHEIAVHPRARGEQARHCARVDEIEGSSPRTRGTGQRLGLPLRRPRFIPAHAGNSRSTFVAARAIAVHPRARGEQAHVGQLGTTALGSSPRTRGTGICQSFPARCRRFIPAHAGNSRSSTPSPALPAVHPRARGEQFWPFSPEAVSGGSSPRTRGTVDPLRPAALQHRFIPAHAGNSPSRRNARRNKPVHPRARGEQEGMRKTLADIAGSSPRTRGTVHIAGADITLRRFIPAHAGNSARASGQTAALPVHPRARGEQFQRSSTRRHSRGSSPRTRGTAHRCTCTAPPGRFIPAHAGNRAR